MKKLNTVAMSILLAPALFATSNLSSALHSGKVTGQVRYYYMRVDNAPGLKDYFGSAIGGHLKYETGSFYNFKAGVAFYTTNSINTNVNATSTQPGTFNGHGGYRNSRYVIRMIDSTDPTNHAVNGVGQLYLNYHHSKTSVTIGRMVLKTPLLNPEDGWMIPTFFQGAWVKTKALKHFILQAGFINGIWVRNVPRWRNVGDSLGYGYGNGASPAGGPGNYYGNTKSDGIFVAGARYTGIRGLKLQAWDYYVQNIYNATYLESKYDKKMGGSKLVAGVQYLGERAVGNGGNSNPKLSYMKHGEISNTYGAMVGAGYHGSFLSLAVKTTTKQGRLIMPREWAKPPLYTFQFPETDDGMGGADAWVVNYKQNYKFLGLKGLRTNISYGRHFHQSITNNALNKYGFPSYTQFVFGLYYKFSGTFKDLHVRYMFARKNAIASTKTNQPAKFFKNQYVFGKNGQIIQEVVLNYNF